MPKIKNMEVVFVMKRKPPAHAAPAYSAWLFPLSLAHCCLAADSSEPTQPSPCYPTAVTRSEDGTEIRKMDDLGPGGMTPAASPSDF